MIVYPYQAGDLNPEKAEDDGRHIGDLPQPTFPGTSQGEKPDCQRASSPLIGIKKFRLT